MKNKRVGIIGFGYIGKKLYEKFSGPGGQVDVAFVFNRSPHRVSGLPGNLVLEDLSEFAKIECDLIVEVADPSITREFGAEFLRFANYMPVSSSVLADETLLQRLSSVASENGTQLFIPHGAVVGVDNLLERTDRWASICVTMKKNPKSIPSLKGDGSQNGPRTVYEGNVAGIADKFPNNVNMMVTCALATVGVEDCHCELIVDETLEEGIAVIEAVASDGSRLRMEKAAPMIGVSGVEMFDSVYHSVLRSLALYKSIEFV
jgi:aspartate dehydrogenase